MTVGYRDRLLQGLKESIEEKGYAATTIADIVRRAGVSKRTFYEHFDDKEGCFLGLYVEMSGRVVQAMKAAAQSRGTWSKRVASAVRAYLGSLQTSPALTRTIFLELNSAGGRALQERRKVHQEFARFLQEMVKEGKKDRAQVRELSPTMALAIVGGVNELVLATIESASTLDLDHLEETATQLFLSLVAKPT